MFKFFKNSKLEKKKTQELFRAGTGFWQTQIKLILTQMTRRFCFLSRGNA